jgi:hypothetical protein
VKTSGAVSRSFFPLRLARAQTNGAEHRVSRIKHLILSGSHAANAVLCNLHRPGIQPQRNSVPELNADRLLVEQRRVCREVFAHLDYRNLMAHVPQMDRCLAAHQAAAQYDDALPKFGILLLQRGQETDIFSWIPGMFGTI